MLSVNALDGVAKFSVGSATGTNLIVDKTGKVGVGTTTPSATFAVTGYIYTTGGIGIGIATTTGGVVESTSNAIVGGFLNVNSTGTSTFQGGITAGGFDSSEGLNITGSSIRLTSGATSTFDNGISLSGGCFRLIDGSCAISSGQAQSASGWTDDGTIVRLTTASDQVGIGTANPSAASTLTVAGTIDLTGSLGISSTSPSQKLVVGGNLWLDSNYIYIGSSSQSVASTTIVYFKSATTTIQQNVNAFSISTTTSTSTPSNNLFPIFSIDGLNARIGLSTATPYAMLSVNALDGVAKFSVGSATGTNLIVDKTGKVGVATTNPAATFAVTGDIYTTGGIGIGIATTTGGVVESTSNLAATGDLSVGDDVTIVGGLGLGTSATTTNGQFELSGDIQVGDDISVTDDVTILGGLGIGIGTTTNGFLELTGSIYGAGDLDRKST